MTETKTEKDRKLEEERELQEQRGTRLITEEMPVPSAVRYLKEEK
jgi:hypothetical protein